MNTTAEVTNFDAEKVASAINQLVTEGKLTHVNGREVWARFRKGPATAWRNGSLSVDVRGRSAGKEGTLWVKAGQTLVTEDRS